MINNKSIYKYEENNLLSMQSLEQQLNSHLVGTSLFGYALRTRSKVVKEEVCKALGYPVPTSFKRTQPRFPAQNLDVYVQKSNNLQIWNEEIDVSRRYALIQVSDDDVILKVKVIDGSELEVLDTTGKLTAKYQARVVKEKTDKRISIDSDLLVNFQENINAEKNILYSSPNDNPNIESILTIDSLYNKLRDLKGKKILNTSVIMERPIADEAHKLVCELLGYNSFEDDGKFPDLKNQLLEVKLQTSPTIDLGLHMPNSDNYTNLKLNDIKVKVSDTRYLIIIASRNEDNHVEIEDFYLVSGKFFFDYFDLFGGKVKNTKLQIPLPSNFFD